MLYNDTEYYIDSDVMLTNDSFPDVNVVSSLGSSTTGSACSQFSDIIASGNKLANDEDIDDIIISDANRENSVCSFSDDNFNLN